MTVLIRPRYVGADRRMELGFAGFALILVLFLVGFVNDVSMLTGRGFSVR